MKKIAIYLSMVLLLVCIPTCVKAETKTRSINGVSYTIYSSITRNSASAGTVSGDSTFYGYVSSKYSYVNPDTLVTGYVYPSKSGSGSSAAHVLYAPSGYRSVKVTSNHKAICGTEIANGMTTSAVY